MGHGQADPQNGIGAEVRFISGAIRFAEDAVNGFLLGGIPPDEGPGQFVINGADGGAYPFAAVTGRVAVPFFAGLVPAGGSAAGDGCDAYGTALQGDLHPDGRVAAAIQDFEALYFGNGGMGHGFLLWVLRGRRDGAAAGPAGAGIEMPFPKPALRKNFCLPIVCRFWGGFMRRNVLQYRQKAEQVFYK